MEIKGTLDEKCRISLPSPIRGNLKENKLILTNGLDHCVWIFEPKEWEFFSKKLIDSAALSLNKQLVVQRHFIMPKVEIEIDKAGRIAIPQSLRDYACLSREIQILEGVNHLEIWDSGQYAEYKKATEAQLYDVVEEMGPVTLFSGNSG
jgi:MraZ protein